MSIRWAYGVTTVPGRLDNGYRRRTLDSLARAGFPDPYLFIDGDNGELIGASTRRYPPLRVSGNWCCSLAELLFRHPEAERFAMFQDDFLTYPNLRQYLEGCPYPDGRDGRPLGYWNLYSFTTNEDIAPVDRESGRPLVGWYEARLLGSGREYHGKQQQAGKGAVALIFDRSAVYTLLSSRRLWERSGDVHRGWRAIDGGIVESMNQEGYREFVHSPSLVQHIGEVSSWGNNPHLRSESFRGEDFDALRLRAMKVIP